MKKRICILLSAIALLLGCTPRNEKPKEKARTVFELEMKELKTYFQIPGMAILIKKGNTTLYENYFGVANTTTEENLSLSLIHI